MSDIQSMIAALLLATLLNIFGLFRWKAKRRAAQARLRMIESVTAMEALMLSGNLRSGSPCHDWLHIHMYRSQLADRVYLPWKVWKIGDCAEVHKKVVEELNGNEELKSIVEQHSRAQLAFLRYTQPLVCVSFMLWICFVFGGLLASLSVLKTGLYAVRSLDRLISLFYVAAEAYRRESALWATSYQIATTFPGGQVMTPR